MNLQGRTAIVAGGASGLGAAVVKRLLADGARVAILDLNDELGQPLAAGGGDHAIFIHTDVRDEASAAHAVGLAEEALGAVYLCVNCAGVGGQGATATAEGALPLEDFRRLIEVNLVGTFNIARLAAAHMIHNDPDPVTGERGLIVNTASTLAFDGRADTAAYSASKAGIVGLTLPMTRDLSPHGIRVVAIAPGPFDTPLLAQLPPEAIEALGAQSEFPKRVGAPDEFAALVAHIAANTYLNGLTIRLDGGMREPPR